METIQTEIPEVKLLRPRVFGDERGYFMESFNARDFAGALGYTGGFVQDNVSLSRKGVLRGLHYQILRPQGKLVRVLDGEIFDVAVDLRRWSDTFGRWVGVVLRGDDAQWIWVPPGFAHGFAVRSESARILYKTTEYYHPEHECTLAWDDPRVGIDWSLTEEPLLSEKDQAGLGLRETPVYGGQYAAVLHV